MIDLSREELEKIRVECESADYADWMETTRREYGQLGLKHLKPTVTTALHLLEREERLREALRMAETDLECAREQVELWLAASISKTEVAISLALQDGAK